MTQGTKLVNLRIDETSGVDHPAHLHEGWLVLKSATSAEVLDALDALATEPDAPATTEATAEKEGAMPEDTTVETPTVDAAAEEFLKSAPEAVAKMISDLRKERDEAAEVAKAATAAANEAAEVAKAAAEELAKERETAADAAAIEKAREDYANLGIDVEAVAPALRKFAATDADTATAIVTALKAASAQLGEAGVFGEVGKSADKVVTTNGDALTQIQALAKAKVAAGDAKTEAEAIALVAQENPALYTEYTTQKGA